MATAIYRYKFLGVDIDEVATGVMNPVSISDQGMVAYVDIQATTTDKSDLDEVMALLGYAFDSTNPTISASSQAFDASVIVAGLLAETDSGAVGGKVTLTGQGPTVGGVADQRTLVHVHTVITGIKTGNYTANANEIVRFDSTGGTFNLTFPAAPHSGDSVTFVDVGGAAGNGGDAVTFVRNGNDFVWVDQTLSTGNKTSNANYGTWEWFYNGVFWSLA
jgi:hypothetical protein